MSLHDQVFRSDLKKTGFRVPVEVRKSPVRSGNGIFLTKPAKKGELL